MYDTVARDVKFFGFHKKVTQRDKDSSKENVGVVNEGFQLYEDIEIEGINQDTK